MILFSLFIFLCMLVFPCHASAHLVNQNVGEFYAGMLHPLTSAEHLIPMAALGLSAGRQGIQSARRVLLILPLTLMAGTWFGNLFPGPSEITHVVNLFMIPALGLLLIRIDKISSDVIAALAAAIGFILGWRSGIDMVGSNISLKFIPGVGLTGFILVTLISAWIAQSKSRWMKNALRTAGGIVVAAGIFLLIDVLINRGEGSLRFIGIPDQEHLMIMIKSETLSLPFIMFLFLSAAGWGAFHALTPGHGKALVGAYLIGSRGTALHALYLGLTVTATHTMGVLSLGLITLFASNYILPEQLMPWLSFFSGFLIMTIGASILFKRIKEHSGHHHHSHDDNHHHNPGSGHTHGHYHEHHHGPESHSHLPPGIDGRAVTWKEILGLGISGGLLPCPAALVLLLTCISIGRNGLGVLMVIAFSVGLAGILTGIGLLFIKGSRLLHGLSVAEKLQRYAPPVSALVILFIGLIIMATSVKDGFP